MSEESGGIYRDEQGQSFCDVGLRHRDGRRLATIKVRTAGHTHTGIASCVIAGDETEFVLADASWDCREWQWWQDHGYGDEKRPRFVPATSGFAELPDGVRISSAYTCDGIETVQEWWFRTQERDDVLTYDCRQTVTNRLPTALTDYGQFFACYTEPNRDKSQFYWAQDGQFKTFLSLGGRHVDAYIVAPGSAFERSGVIPHALRGGGRVADTWHHPALVGHPTAQGWRHIVFTEPATTAALASGGNGIAMDYTGYPGKRTFAAGETFALHVRHHLAKLPEAIDRDLLEALWRDFAADLP